MKKNTNKYLLSIALFVLGGLLGYCIGVRNASISGIFSKADKATLVGIWQASGGMASGWADRYNFYSDGKFHFYPNQMSCQIEEKEELGTWEIKDDNLTLTTTSEIVISNKCDQNGFTKEVGRKNNILKQPWVRTRYYLFFGTLKNDSYPSMLFEGTQYWKFSSDPSSYGGEKFPQE